MYSVFQFIGVLLIVIITLKCRVDGNESSKVISSLETNRTNTSSLVELIVKGTVTFCPDNLISKGDSKVGPSKIYCYMTAINIKMLNFYNFIT